MGPEEQASGYRTSGEGFGIMYAPATVVGPNTSNSGAASFSAETPFISSEDGGRTPFSTLSNPFPNGFNAAKNADDGLLTLLGQDIQAQVRGDRTPYVAQWHFNIQRELRNEMLLDIGYAGSAGVKLSCNDAVESIGGPVSRAWGALSQSIPNPFLGVVPPTTALGLPTTTLGQLLRPYPQFGDVAYDWGSFAHSSNQKGAGPLEAKT